MITRTRRVNNPHGNSTVEDQVSVQETDAAKAQREELQRQINSLNWQIQSKRSQQNGVRESIRKLRSELLVM